MIQRVEYRSATEGTKLVVFGAIHGDEHCGTEGMKKVMADIESSALPLLSGSVTFVPVCNPEAYARKARCIEADLNRVFKKSTKPASAEAALANELCAIADEADALLDLHSSFAPGPVNAFVDYPTPENIAFVAALGAEFEIFGWPQVYESTPKLLSHTTERYMHDRGRIGTTFECGQHDEPSSIPVAERTIRRALAHFGITQANEEPPAPATRLVMTKVFICDDKGDAFAEPWTHLQKVAADTLIARRKSGEEIRTSMPSVMIFPYADAEKGDEWFYLATEQAQ